LVGESFLVCRSGSDQTLVPFDFGFLVEESFELVELAAEGLVSCAGAVKVGLGISMLLVEFGGEEV